MALFTLLSELTYRKVLLPPGARIDLDPVRDAATIAWLAKKGKISAQAGMLKPHTPAAPARALRSWSSGCCGGKR